MRSLKAIITFLILCEISIFAQTNEAEFRILGGKIYNVKNDKKWKRLSIPKGTMIFTRFDGNTNKPRQVSFIFGKKGVPGGYKTIHVKDFIYDPKDYRRQNLPASSYGQIGVFLDPNSGYRYRLFTAKPMEFYVFVHTPPQTNWGPSGEFRISIPDMMIVSCGTSATNNSEAVVKKAKTRKSHDRKM